jgi:hypothetical protein
MLTGIHSPAPGNNAQQRSVKTGTSYSDNRPGGMQKKSRISLSYAHGMAIAYHCQSKDQDMAAH